MAGGSKSSSRYDTRNQDLRVLFARVASASLNNTRKRLYQPSHGSATDIAGNNLD